MTAWLGVSPDMCEIEWDVVCVCVCVCVCVLLQQDVCKLE